MHRVVHAWVAVEGNDCTARIYFKLYVFLFTNVSVLYKVWSSDRCSTLSLLGVSV